MMMTTMTTMLTELCAPVIEILTQQYVGRMLDYHMGIYELEEGEIIDYTVTLDDLRMIAERIVLGNDFHKAKEEEEDVFYEDNFTDYEEDDEVFEEENPYFNLCME
jgi:hypothetical protein